MTSIYHLIFRHKMEVRLRTSIDGRKMEIITSVEPTDTVGQIGNRYESDIGIPYPKQRFIFEGEYVLNDTTIASVMEKKNIPFHEWYTDKPVFVVTDMGPVSEKEMASDVTIIVTLTNSLCLKTYYWDTIIEIKYKIYSVKNWAPHEQRLVASGKILIDEYTLQDYAIHEYHTIHLCGKLCGD